MRLVVIALVGLFAATAAQAQWTSVDTPDGQHACRHQPDGLTVPSGNLSVRFSLAVCNSWNHYPVDLVALGVDPTCAAFALPLAVKIGMPFASLSYTPCFSGGDAASAAWSVERIDGDAIDGFSIDSTGVLRHMGAGPAGSGHLAVVRTALSGVSLRVPFGWRVGS